MQLLYTTLMLFGLSFFVLTESLKAQIKPVQIYDLKYFTDSIGVDHLFYRIDSNMDSSDSYRNDIYHLNLITSSDTLFLEDFSDDSEFAFKPFRQIVDYYFEDSIVEEIKYILIEETVDLNSSIRNKSNDVLYDEEYFLGIEDLFFPVDSDSVFANIDSRTIISFDNGNSWPTTKEIDQANSDEEFVLDFPLIDISIFNKYLLFGLVTKITQDGVVREFVRSTDNGITQEVISTNFYPSKKMIYSIDGKTIFLVYQNDNSSEGSSNIWELWRSDNRGSVVSWELLQTQEYEYNLSISTNSNDEEKLFFSNVDSLFSMNLNGSDKLLENKFQNKITSITSADNYKHYVSVTDAIYEVTTESINEIKKIVIPVHTEPDEKEIPKTFKLFQNYPNPFNPSTTISYRMNKAGIVELKLYDILGRLVQEIVNEYKSSGEHKIRFDASNLSSGTYLIRGKLGETITTQKITLIK